MRVQHDSVASAWRKSSYSSANGQCVEVADHLPGVVPVRDSKLDAGPQLAFGASAWALFVGELKDQSSR
ncbi:DUF397 domain-containing protein [Streptomyces sp. NPDC048718]|uniref:DUF397 domain-containing protein n=1 Tax=Streptomyces sp. NPDC048718 TaxID=3365587 RepID=UPI0037185315